VIIINDIKHNQYTIWIIGNNVFFITDEAKQQVNRLSEAKKAELDQHAGNCLYALFYQKVYSCV